MKTLTVLIASLLIAAEAMAACHDEAGAAMTAGRTGEAVRILKDCLENESADRAMTWLLLGEARQEQRRKGAAVEAYSNAIELADRRALIARASLGRGEVRLSQRDRDGAFADFSAAIDADPSMADAYYERARLLHKRDDEGDEDAALADYTRAIELDDSNARAFFYRAMIYRKRGLDHLAIADYDRAIELAPNFVRAHAERSFTFIFPLLPVILVLILG